MARASFDTFIPGDSLLFKAGQTHSGRWNVKGGGTFDSTTYDSTFTSAQATAKSAVQATGAYSTLITNATNAGQTAPQAATWGDIWSSQIALPTAQDAAWTAAQAGTSWITIGRYGTGANPILDGGSSSACAIYFTRPSQGGWRIRDLEIRNYTAAGIAFSNHTADATGLLDVAETYRANVNGLWIHDCSIHDITVGHGASPPWPNADATIFISGFDRPFATGISVLGVNYARVEDCTVNDTDMPLYMTTGQHHRVDQFTSTRSWWSHTAFAACYRGSFTNSSLTNQCETGYPDGSAALFLSHNHQFLVQGCTLSNTPRPVSPISGTQIPDGAGIDFETRQKHTVVDSCTLADNAGSALMVLQSYAVGPIPAYCDANLWTRNVMTENSYDGTYVALGRTAIAPAQGTMLWSGNQTTFLSPPVGISGVRWLQSGQSGNVLPGTTAGTPWIYGADNTEV